MMTPTEKPPNWGSETLIDPSDKLYLHHSDHPNCSLASTLLDGDNYGHWKRAIEVLLMTKNKLGFVNGNMKKPESDSNRLTQWERCNNMMISWLLHSVVSDIVESIVYCGTANETWDELGQYFGISIAESILYCVLITPTDFIKIKRLWDKYVSVLKIPHALVEKTRNWLRSCKVKS